MDWSKAKKILIITLIFLNIILFGFVLVNYYENLDKTRTSSFAKQTEALLNEKGILLDTYIPKNQVKLPSLLVEFESYSKADLNERFFESLGNISEPSSEFTKIEFGKESLSIINTRRLIYENNIKENAEDLTLSKAQEIAKNFLLNRKFETSNMKLTIAKKIDNEYYLYYSKLFENSIVERSFTDLVVSSNGVLRMDRLWIDVKDKSSNYIYLTSASKALLTLLQDNDYIGKTIKTIEECFYFDPEEQGYIEDITKATQGRAIPAWRIQFDDGESTVVDSI